jgi:cellobiose dehydrogenase (acceptor)
MVLPQFVWLTLVSLISIGQQTILLRFSFADLYLAVRAQSQATCDTQNGFCFQSYVAPGYDMTFSVALPVQPASGLGPTDFIGEILAPISAAWVGFSLGGSMADSLLLLVWPNGNEFVTNTRWTE